MAVSSISFATKARMRVRGVCEPPHDPASGSNLRVIVPDLPGPKLVAASSSPGCGCPARRESTGLRRGEAQLADPPARPPGHRYGHEPYAACTPGLYRARL